MAPSTSSPESSSFVRTGRSAANNARQAIKRQVSSSPEPDTPPRRSRPTPKSSVVKATSLSRTFSGNTSSDSIEFVDMVSPTLAPTSTTRPTITERERREILANISGELVWVKVNELGDVAGTDGIETYWWPAELRSGSLNEGPTRVRLIRFTPSHPAEDMIIGRPNQSIILSMTVQGHPRFTSSTFRDLGGERGPPAKKPKTDLQDRFQIALDLMIEADEADNDGLPCFVSTSLPSSQPVTHTSSMDSVSASRSPVKDPGPDPSFLIGRELVFARVKREHTATTEYWPAKILEYVSPTERQRRPKYKIKFMDDIELLADRDMFYSQDQNEFFTCKLGQFESNTDLNEDDVEGDGPIVDVDREESPAPAESPPSPNAFCELSIREQFAYVKPVMRAIIDDEYEPARQRHKDFMNQKSRQNLRTQSGGIGDLSAKEFDQLGKVVRRWLMPQGTNVQEMETSSGDKDDGDGSAEAASDSATVRNPSSRASSVLSDLPDDVKPELPRTLSQATTSITSVSNSDSVDSPPQQLPKYRDLHENDKLDYCMLVLQHEALLQLLLWRHGKRRSVELLDPAEEESLHELAAEDAEETDMVKTVRHIRELGRRTRRLGPERSSGAAAAISQPQVLSRTRSKQMLRPARQ